MNVLTRRWKRLTLVAVALLLAVAAALTLSHRGRGGAVATTRTAGDQTATAQAGMHAPAPDLRFLLAQLTSADPGVQEGALPVDLRARTGQRLGVLPPGAHLHLQPGSWRTTGLDEHGTPALGTIMATLTRDSGQQPQRWRLYVLRAGNRWLLYGTARP